MKTLKIDLTVLCEIRLELPFLTIDEFFGYFSCRVMNLCVDIDFTQSDEQNMCVLSIHSNAMNKQTARIEINKMIKVIKTFKEEFSFDKIEILGNYEVNGDELLILINEVK